MSDSSVVAVICAMDWELAHLRDLLPDETVEWHNGQCAYSTSLGRQPIVLAMGGMGMVSAGASTQAVINRYAPSAVLNYGCAGAHRADLLPGDIVVGTRVIAYDNLRESPDGELKYAGMAYLAAGRQCRVDALEADPGLLAAARRAAHGQLERHELWPRELGWPAAVAHRLPQVVFGTVVSADRWNRSRATIEALTEHHASMCEDMEAAAIALVCASAGVPFLSIKDISNNELLRQTVSGDAMLAEIGAGQIARRAAKFALATLAEFASG